MRVHEPFAKGSSLAVSGVAGPGGGTPQPTVRRTEFVDEKPPEGAKVTASFGTRIADASAAGGGGTMGGGFGTPLPAAAAQLPVGSHQHVSDFKARKVFTPQDLSFVNTASPNARSGKNSQSAT